MWNTQVFLKDLAALVAFRTLPQSVDEHHKALMFITNRVHPDVRVDRLVHNGVPILLAGNGSFTEPDILYLTHLDVVAGDAHQFTLTMKRDKAYGRGVSDMKFSIPIGIYLLNYLREKKDSPSFLFAVTCDEEIGGFQGARHLSHQRKIRPKVALVPDGGDNFVFVKSEKGVCQLTITSGGTSAHAAYLWKGKNALIPLIELVHKLTKKYSKNNSSPTEKITMNIGTFHGGESVNQVCSAASLQLDFRFPPTTSSNVIQQEVEKIAKRIDKNLVVTLLAQGVPTSTDPHSPFSQLFLSSMKEVLMEEIRIEAKPGASDARHFSEVGIPTLMTKPQGGEIHSAKEYVSISSCHDFYEIIRVFIEKYTNTK